MFEYISLMVIGAGFMLMGLSFIPEHIYISPMAKSVTGAVVLVASQLIAQRSGGNDEDTTIT